MLSLKIYEIAVKDAGKGFARVDQKDMRALGVNPWDMIEIGGKRKTVVRVMQLEKSLQGKSILQVDGITRENARVGIDDRSPCASLQESGSV